MERDEETKTGPFDIPKMKDFANEIARQQRAIQDSFQQLTMPLNFARNMREEVSKNWLVVERQMDAIRPIKMALNNQIAQISEELKRVSQTGASIAAQMQEASKHMAGLAEVIQSFWKQGTIWDEWARQYKRITEGYRYTWKELQKRFKITERDAMTILLRYKWFVSPSMPISFISRVVEVGRQPGNRTGAMNKLYVDYFTRDDYSQLESMVDGWRMNKLFARRMKIIRDCIQVMKRADHAYNYSNVVLPTLIAQIDGIQQLFMEQNGLIYKSRGQWVDEDGNMHHWKDWYRNITCNSELMHLANKMLLDILFQHANRSEPLDVPFTFNRHKIMHGENLQYGRVANVIRAFLVLDFLATISV